ncbi:MAG TPA: DegT/DnrJ/EryC1/StrS family aminotransferase [Microbacteriaceae bacterium]|jgi:dTDP-4-amino-4,6-dideoxygalactose transaminase|nr:DegT/DnrJ/EryC1/StrS family aminotransferase [Microbacteriaceae bacterium]
MPTIPITRPFFGEEELRAVQEPLRDEWVVQGPQVKRFEDDFARYTGTEHASATSSCTTALHIAVAALGLSQGDEVLVPAFTWVSTANVVEYLGATPIFCDIDLETFNVDIAAFDAGATDKTVGMIPVHLFGLLADVEGFTSLAASHKLWVLEDAACGFGGWYGDRHAGTFGDYGAFSFHPRKSITTGEGGMLTTADGKLDSLARSLRDHGASRSDHARHGSTGSFLLSEYNHLGFNFRMTDIQGALGVAQMQRADWILGRRRKLAAAYDELLADLDWLTPQRIPDGYVSGYQAYVCLFHPEEPTLANVEGMHERRNRLMATLEGQGIATRQGTHAPIAVGYYADKYNLRVEDFPNAYIADRLSLALPLYPQLTPDDQQIVVDALRRAIDEE